MKEFYNSNKKVLNIVFIIIGIVFVVYLAWVFYFSKQVIFNEEEQALQEAGKKYFEMYANKMPSSENEVSTVSAKDLYDKKFVESKDLYIPKTKKGCSLEASWVKARKENGKIEYYTYLKCGKYESKTDHEGPEITLNGEKEITLDINEKYEEKGVKSVVDKEDGTIDINKVTIKNNEIDSSKVGTYEISYTAYDSLKNKTTEKRIVKVVKKLEGIIKENTNGKNYYVGEPVNNYVQFSGMLWRIVGLNEDSTIKIISADSISNVVYGNQESYNKSNIYIWLNEYFYDHLASKDYIAKSNWCVGNVASSVEDGCKETVKANVGLLTLNEYNKSINDNISYLAADLMESYWLTNKKDGSSVWIAREGSIETFKTEELTTTKPVINIKKGVYVEDGDGSFENPYTLGDYKKGKPNSNLNDRVVGEFVSYSNYLWRVMDTKEDGTVIIMIDNVYNTQAEPITINYDQQEANYKYDISQKGNIGYQINKEIKNYLVNDEKIMSNEWILDEFDSSKVYNKFETSTFKSKYSIPKSYDLFSASGGYKSWLLDYSKTKGNILFVGPGGRGYDISIDEASSNAIKLVIKLDETAKVSSGKGTYSEPYSVK